MYGQLYEILTLLPVSLLIASLTTDSVYNSPTFCAPSVHIWILLYKKNVFFYFYFFLFISFQNITSLKYWQKGSPSSLRHWRPQRWQPGHKRLDMKRLSWRSLIIIRPSSVPTYSCAGSRDLESIPALLGWKAVPGGNPCKHEENMQTPHRKTPAEVQPGTCQTTVLTTMTVSLQSLKPLNVIAVTALWVCPDLWM